MKERNPEEVTVYGIKEKERCSTRIRSEKEKDL